MDTFVVRGTVIDDAASIARVRAESWRATYRGIVPDAYLDAIDAAEWAERQRRAMEQQPADLVALVAEVRGDAVGWALGGPNRDATYHYAGELYAIYLLPEYQRVEIGTRLTVAIAQSLVSQGLDSMALWVLEDNQPARRFYQAMGGTLCGSRQEQIAGACLAEVAYGWEALAGLIGSGAAVQSSG